MAHYFGANKKYPGEAEELRYHRKKLVTFNFKSFFESSPLDSFFLKINQQKIHCSHVFFGIKKG